MVEIQTPLKIPDLDLRPELSGAILLSPDMQQVLALLAGFWLNQRILIKATPTGGLCVNSLPLKDIYHETAIGDNYTKQAADMPCSEVMVMAHPDNVGKVWVRTNITATENNSWPLEAKEVISFTVTNLNQLQLLIKTSGEKAIIAYTI